MLVCGAKGFYKGTFKGLGPSVCMPGPPLVRVCVFLLDTSMRTEVAEDHFDY